ncbi:MAG TPA: efflux RND transporter periplasmic adaptor subunit [Sphingobacteriaceae bacterium]
MKKILSIATVLFIISCSEKSQDKSARLEELKKQRSDLNAEISKLESEVGAGKADSAQKEVAVLELSQAPFRSYVKVQGKVDAEENVNVSPEMPGSVTAIHVKVGQSVSKGQVLAQIDDQVLRQNMAQVQTQLDLATNIFNRQKNLWEQKIGTEVQYLTAKSQMESLQKQLATLRSEAAMYKIKSPISGTVDEMELKIGQSVSPGMPAGIRIVNASKLKVKALVAESYAGRINQGDEVQVSLPDVPDNLNTRVSFASRVIDPTSRSFSVEVNLPARKNYRPNMLAILNIVDYERANALAIPINAIQKSETSEYVYLIENGKAKRVDVKTGKVSEGKAEVLSGLKAGDRLIVQGLDDLNPGDAVKI